MGRTTLARRLMHILFVGHDGKDDVGSSLQNILVPFVLKANLVSDLEKVVTGGS